MINKKFSIGNNQKTFFEVYISDYDNRRKKPMVIICPGGGFLDCSPCEGEPVALFFLRNGFQAGVLTYTTAASGSVSSFPSALRDLAQAIVISREHAEEWQIDENQIVILGFSAGGNLCALYENYWKSILTGEIGGSDSRKPNAAVLCYPLTDSRLNIEEFKALADAEVNMEQVTGKKAEHPMREFFDEVLTAQFGTVDPDKDLLDAASPILHISKEITPPTFVWTTFRDGLLSPMHSICYAQRLYEAGIDTELHVYHNGPHGLSLADCSSAKKQKEINAHVATWGTLAVEWLKEVLSGTE